MQGRGNRKEARKKGPLSPRERDRVRGSGNLTNLARTLRALSTDAERLLWHHLRGRNLGGFKFRRQVVIEPYIVDFVCLDARLIIEADGGQHVEMIAEDAARTEFLEERGYRVLRFWNHEILTELDNVLECIHSALLMDIPSPWPSPGGRGNRGVPVHRPGAGVEEGIHGERPRSPRDKSVGNGFEHAWRGLQGRRAGCPK